MLASGYDVLLYAHNMYTTAIPLRERVYVVHFNYYFQSFELCACVYVRGHAHITPKKSQVTLLSVLRAHALRSNVLARAGTDGR